MMQIIALLRHVYYYTINNLMTSTFLFCFEKNKTLLQKMRIYPIFCKRLISYFLFTKMSIYPIFCLISYFLFQFDEGKNRFEGDLTAANIKTFISGNSLPLVIEFTQEVFLTLYLFHHHDTTTANNFLSHSGLGVILYISQYGVKSGQ